MCEPKENLVFRSIRIGLVLGLVACGLLVIGCQSEPGKERTGTVQTLKMQLKWFHSAQFVGFYVAKEGGYFADEGLDVSFLEGGTDIDQVAQLFAGKADFALVPAESLFLKNTSEDPMVAIAVVYQLSPLVFAVREDSSIFRPEDFPGKTIAVGKLTEGGFLEGIIQFNALMQHRAIATDAIKIVPYDWDFKGFVDGSVDITPTYMTSGLIKLKHLGVKTRPIWPGDYGLEFYADTLVARESLIKGQPELVRRFLSAVLKGWREAIANQKMALEHTMKYVQNKDESLQIDIMDAQTPLIQTGKHPIGWMESGPWQAMHDTLVGQRLLATPLGSIDKLYTTEFLAAIYQEKK